MKSFFFNFIKSSIPHFHINDDELNLIAENFEEMELEKGEYFLKQGKISGSLILTEGHLRAYTFNENGDEVTTAFYAPPRLIFDVASFFQQKPSVENIIAITKVKGYYSNYKTVDKLFHEHALWREFGRAMLAKEYILFKDRTMRLINLTAEERYAHLMETNSEIFQIAQLRHIASYLNITDTSLSRIRREFTLR
ncbi:Crp/Fnr family transcriptional regulator [Parasediminibacterium paludis]|uniref:Crp/Fnr family transcriptional regulator n=1 Tax=Parasediminibacterium paludis TaxID=908966 RepID=A0ABV8PVP1_9BACT